MKIKTLSQLKKELDKYFSLYIRHKYAVNGIVHCYTCSVSKPVKEMQNGHWVSRTNLATRFSEDNCRPQCVGCNMFNQGRLDVFTVNLMKEGIDIIKLQQSKYQVLKVDSIWYQNQIEHYKQKLKEYE